MVQLIKQYLRFLSYSPFKTEMSSHPHTGALIESSGIIKQLISPTTLEQLGVYTLELVYSNEIP